MTVSPNLPRRIIKVSYFGTYRKDYNRNRTLIDGLKIVGVEVVECHEPLWLGIEDRIQAISGAWIKPAFIFRVLKAYIRLFWRGLHLPEYDIMVCGYPGHFDVFLARILSSLRNRPLAWDILMSLYLITVDRNLELKSPFTVNLVRSIERFALTLPDLLIQDTQSYVDWFVQTHKFPPTRFRLVPIGADDRIFTCDSLHVLPTNPFLVLYYGTFIPNHGVKYILEAANILKNQNGIVFELVGEGPELEYCQELAIKLNLNNVSFIPWMSKSELVKKIIQADVVLGAFGKTYQSVMTIHNKVYEGMSMSRPVITGSSPVTQANFKHTEQIWLCDRDHPESLVEAIQTLRSDENLRFHIAENGHSLFLENYSISKIGACFKNHLLEEINRRSN